MHRRFSFPFTEAEVWREDDVYVAHWPTLDVYSQGDTSEEAAANLAEAIQLFVASCVERDTLGAVVDQQRSRDQA